MTPEQVQKIQEAKTAAQWRANLAAALLAMNNNPRDRKNLLHATEFIADGDRLPKGFGEAVLQWLSDEWNRVGYTERQIVGETPETLVEIPPEGPRRGQWRFEDGAAIDRNDDGTFSARRAGGCGVMCDAGGKCDFENFGDAVTLIRLARADALSIREDG